MQLSLPVQLPVEKHFDNWIVGENDQLVAQLRHSVEQLQEPQATPYNQFFIHARHGSGKSHFLIALCHYAQQSALDSYYLSLSALDTLQPELLEGFSQIPLLCIDDLDAVQHNRVWQIALFDLINQRREWGTGVTVFAASENIVSTPNWFELADLHSRLQWGTTFHLHQLDGESKKELLSKLAEDRGMKFSEVAINFILNHCERSTQHLVDVIERLDRRSLEEKKALSIQLVKKELGL